jgi:hypothetical protein
MDDPGLVLVRGPDLKDRQDKRKGWIMSVKFTDAQLVMMSAAAQRKNRCLSAPATIEGAALSKVSAKLVKLGLAREIEATPGPPIWRRYDARQGYALKIDDGRAVSATSRLLNNSFLSQFDSVPDSVGFRCVHGFDLARWTFSTACSHVRRQGF